MTVPVPDIAPARRPTRRPTWPIGKGGWDTHAHVFGPVGRFPYHPGRHYTPPEQTIDNYVAMLDMMGLDYGVLVQPSVYGDDNGAMLYAMERVPGRFITVVELDILATQDATLAAMTKAGVRGLRIRRPSPTPLPRLADIVARVREVGWHVDIHCKSTADAAELGQWIGPLGGRVMVEAMGSPKAGEPLGSPTFRRFLGLLHDGMAYVKLSHAYQVDPAGPPYGGTTPFARAITELVPDRAVWGSDWPHPMRAGIMPDDTGLLDLLPSWAGSVEMANKVLIENPARFYGLPVRAC